METKNHHKLEIINAHEHNLKNVTISLSKSELIAVCGVSGSGKSSFVFDTILKEAHRKFFQTLSHYSRQFLDLSTKPQVSKIKGLSPTIGLSQNETSPSKRATLASFTNLGEILGTLFSKKGVSFCPTHKKPTKPTTVAEIANKIHKKYNNQLIALCSPIVTKKKGNFVSQFEKLSQKGFMRIWYDGKIYMLNQVPKLSPQKKHSIKLIVDYLEVSNQTNKRLLTSLSLALKEGSGIIECVAAFPNGNLDSNFSSFSILNGCEVCGFSFPNLDPRFFSTNSLGQCPSCCGLSYKESPENLQKCEDCLGTGINSLYANIYLDTKNIHDLYLMKLENLIRFLQTFFDSVAKKNISNKQLKNETARILKALIKMNLGYMNLGRRIHTISTGEFQRLRLASILIKELTGMIYILDEPSQGLHHTEVQQLSIILRNLVNQGNTVFVVEHDLDIISKADCILDFGPGGGALGGNITAKFPPHLAKNFIHQSKIAVLLAQQNNQTDNKQSPSKEKNSERSFITIENAYCQNLKIPKARFLKEKINVVTGVSGAGKTSLVVETLYKNSLTLQSKFIHCTQILGINDFKKVLLIDRRPLAKNSSSFPATYLKIFTYIRELFARQIAAKINGIQSSDFSLQSTSGKCTLCKGKGYKIITMKFLDDHKILCEACQGKRYNKSLLTIPYKGKNIAQVLSLTVDEAIPFFDNKKITNALQSASSLGLGYINLGQPLSSLSGGEAQRLKLSSAISTIRDNPCLIIMDEPTRGLHEEDIEKLITTLQNMIKQKNTVILIEHHLGVIKKADWLLEIGPKSADKGGELTYEGESLRKQST